MTNTSSGGRLRSVRILATAEGVSERTIRMKEGLTGFAAACALSTDHQRLHVRFRSRRTCDVPQLDQIVLQPGLKTMQERACELYAQ